MKLFYIVLCWLCIRIVNPNILLDIHLQFEDFLLDNKRDPRKIKVIAITKMRKMPEVEYCESEPFTHEIFGSENKIELMENKWKRARVGESVGLHKICLLPNGLPLMRKCVYNEIKSTVEWERFAEGTHIKCYQPLISDKLNNLLNNILDEQLLLQNEQQKYEVTQQLVNIINEPYHKLLPADVQLISEVLKKVAEVAKDDKLADNVLSICNTLMSSDEHVLQLSANLNATNEFLNTFENYMDTLAAAANNCCGCMQNTSISTSEHHIEIVDYAEIGVRKYVAPHVSVFIVNPACANITGIALYDSNTQHVKHKLEKQSIGNFQYRYIYMNDSTNELLRETTDLQLAAFVPTQLWHYIKLEYNLTSMSKNPTIVLKVYEQDSLFVETSLQRSRKPFSKVLSISIPGFENVEFPENLPFILRNNNLEKSTSTDRKLANCGFWNYSTWLISGMQTNTKNSSNERLILCGTKHLTPFSFLISGTYIQNDLSGLTLVAVMTTRALDIISLAGCSLSLAGLLGIWLTAFIFESWRKTRSNQLLLHICAVLTLQMFLFLFVNTNDITKLLLENHSHTSCIALGALLQYTVLVHFAWMFILACLQVQQSINVWSSLNRMPYFMLKCAIVAWLLPLIPMALVIYFAPHSYLPTTDELYLGQSICYPSGNAFLLGIALPVTFVVIANIAMFIYLFNKLSHSELITLNDEQKRHRNLLRLRFSVLLFFLLGLSWLFGIFALMKAGVIFSFLFCLTASMQGFVLFIFFVLMKENTRTDWINLLARRKSKTVNSISEKTNSQKQIISNSSRLT